jgi:CRP/FNR family transcriptional regulator, dissimilatory nitrate respiration regulator
MTRLPLSPARIPETLRRLAYFQAWPDASLERLAAGTKILSLAKNTIVARKGERIESLYVVVSGLVRLFMPLPNNMERVVALVGPGEGLGEACLILGDSSPCQAIAGKDSHVLAVDSRVYLHELDHDLVLARQALELISRRLLDSLRDAEICAQRSSVQRVASYLLLHRPNLETMAFTFQLPARKQDVAAKLGLTQETLSRVLGFLDKQGLIQVAASRIRIEDATRLAQITTMKDCKDAGPEEKILT